MKALTYVLVLLGVMFFGETFYRAFAYSGWAYSNAVATSICMSLALAIGFVVSDNWDFFN